LINKMDISRLRIHSQHIEEEKIKEKTTESKWARTSDGDFLIVGSVDMVIPYSEKVLR